MTNARSDDGLVHSLEKLPIRHVNRPERLVQAGFTWCLSFFSWADGPRYHSPGDGIEARMTRTDQPVSCLKCIAGELGTDTWTLL